MPQSRKFVGLTPSRAISRWFFYLATFDLFPDFSARVRRFVASPLGWMVIAACLAAVCSIGVSPRVWTIFVGLVGVTAIGLVWPWLTLRTLRLWLAFARDRAVEGECVRVTARVENLSILPCYGLTLRSESASENENCLAARLPHCGGMRETECNWKFIPPCRGEFPLDVPWIGTGFPFGLWEARKRAESSPPLIVWPATYPVGPIPVAPADSAVTGASRQQRAGSEGELLGVRPFRTGDSPRRIHWAQSARHDRLIVCELESTGRPAARILIDLDDAIHSNGSQGTREWAIRIAASFAKGWIESGAEIAVLAEGIEIPAFSGGAHLRRILDAFAKLPRSSNFGLEDMLLATKHQRATREIQVVITTDQRRVPRRLPRFDMRWVVLNRRGFSARRGGDAAMAEGDNPSSAGIRFPWLAIESPEHVQFALRHGWSETRHGW